MKMFITLGPGIPDVKRLALVLQRDGSYYIWAPKLSVCKDSSTIRSYDFCKALLTLTLQPLGDRFASKEKLKSRKGC